MDNFFLNAKSITIDHGQFVSTKPLNNGLILRGSGGLPAHTSNTKYATLHNRFDHRMESNGLQTQQIIFEIYLDLTLNG